MAGRLNWDVLKYFNSIGNYGPRGVANDERHAVAFTMNSDVYDSMTDYRKCRKPCSGG